MATTFPTKRALTGALALLALGCQSFDEGDAQERLAQEVPSDPSIDAGASEGSADGAVEKPSDAVEPEKPHARPSTPKPPFFVDVTANGTGCPAGSWSSDLESDGVLFGNYEISIGENERIAFKDCNVTVKLHSSEGFQYRVSDVSYEGYAYLEQGVRGFQTVNYYFQGNPVPSVDKEKRTHLTGPVDRSYRFQDVVTTADAVWSPCGRDRSLQVVTRIGLQKEKSGAGTGAGYIKVDRLGGLKLSWRKC